MTFPEGIKTSDFTYPLPESRIADRPLPKRDDSKLLVFGKDEIADRYFHEIPGLLPKDSLIVYNRSKVIHARLLFTKTGGSRIEIFCLEPVSPFSDIGQAMQQTSRSVWKCLVGNASRWKDGALTLNLDQGRLTAVMAGRSGDAFLIEFSWSPAELPFASVVVEAGRIPLPPYIRRQPDEADLSRYQTIFAADEGSVAAPTAGLHFTGQVFDALHKKGIDTESITLHVGAGTFLPVKSHNAAEHIMHSEQVSVDTTLVEKLAVNRGTLVATGTTTVRSLESLYYLGACCCKGIEPQSRIGQWDPYKLRNDNIPANEAFGQLSQWLKNNNMKKIRFSTSVMIVPGYRFRVADAMITNFHQPGSTLLMLIAAFVGDSWKDIYAHALEGGYRFLSYGDACLLHRGHELSHER